MIGRVLRILEFTTPLADTQIDRLLQDEIAPRPADHTGLARTLIGRRLTKDMRRYLVATVWDDREAMEGAVLDGGVAVYQAPLAPYLGNARLVAVDLGGEWSSCRSATLSRIALIVDERPATGGAFEGTAEPGIASRSDPARRPCLILSAGLGSEQVLLAGWPREAEPLVDQTMPAEALVVLDRIYASSGAGLGSEYEVLSDRVTEPSP